MTGRAMPGALHVLAVDDERAALDEMVFLLERCDGVGAIDVALDATDALRRLRGDAVDAVFLDVSMPGLDGLASSPTRARSPAS